MVWLRLKRAWVHGVEHVIKDAQLVSKIKFRGEFDAEAAEALGAGWLLHEDKAGMRKVELETALYGLLLKLVVPEMEKHSLVLEPRCAYKFVVAKAKRKPMVQFVAEHVGNPFSLLEYLVILGGAEGELTIEPLQQALVVEPQPEETGEVEEEIPEEYPMPLPTDPNVLEWRTQDEIRAGVPRFVPQGGSK